MVLNSYIRCMGPALESGFRSVTKSGGSHAITLPKDGLERAGVDVEDLDDREIFVWVDADGIVHVDPTRDDSPASPLVSD